METIESDVLICDRHKLCEYFGISSSRVSQLTRAGVLIKIARNQYDAPASLQGFIAYKLEGGSSGTRDVVEARAKLYGAQTVKTELEVDRIKRETIPSDQHLADMRELQQIFDNALDGIDPTLANDLAELGEPAAISDRLTLETNSLRQAVADAIVAYTCGLQ